MPKAASPPCARRSTPTLDTPRGSGRSIPRMSVPTYDQFIEPILRLLVAHPEGMTARAAHDEAANALALTSTDREVLLPSGSQPMYKNRAGWAHDRLKRAGLSSSPRRGFWKVTSDGVSFAQQHPQRFSPELSEKLAMGYIGVKLRASPDTATVEESQPQAAAVSTPLPAVASPDDRLGLALAELRQSASSELLELLSAVSPSFFETIVLDLLHRMGYGANRADLQRVGGSGDEGIDGIISLDRLGLEKVYVQAKRWQSSVGRPELQAFYGAPRWAKGEERRLHHHLKLFGASASVRQVCRGHRAYRRVASYRTHDRSRSRHQCPRGQDSEGRHRLLR